MHSEDLVAEGIHNIQVLRSVIKSQELRYEFPYNEYGMPTDLSFLIISESSKSIVCEVSDILTVNKMILIDILERQISLFPSVQVSRQILYTRTQHVS